MRTRSTRFIAAVAILSVVPLAARSQTDPSLKLSTTNSAAAAEFRAGMSDAQNVSFESATAHFKAAVDADPNFGLARVLYASTALLDPTQLNAELSRLKSALENPMEKVFEIYIKTTPERLWEAITTSEIRSKYQFGAGITQDKIGDSTGKLLEV